MDWRILRRGGRRLIAAPGGSSPCAPSRFSADRERLENGNPLPSAGDTDLEKRITDFAGMFGGAISARSLAKGFYVPDLGFRVAFLSPEQSASTLGAMPPGALVTEVESGRPMARAESHVGDVILSIGGKKVGSENDLRQRIFKIGPGKTEYSFRRGCETKTISLDCSNCEAEQPGNPAAERQLGLNEERQNISPWPVRGNAAIDCKGICVLTCAAS